MRVLFRSLTRANSQRARSHGAARDDRPGHGLGQREQFLCRDSAAELRPRGDSGRKRRNNMGNTANITVGASQLFIAPAGTANSTLTGSPANFSAFTAPGFTSDG